MGRGFDEVAARNFVHEHIDEIQRLNRMIANYYSASSICALYLRLGNYPLPPSPDKITIEILQDIEALTTALVVGYGRLFAESKGVTRLQKSLVPNELVPVHEELIALRNEKFAHHGSHSSTQAEVELFVYEHEVDVKLNWSTGMHLGAAPHWAPLLDWLRDYLCSRLREQLDHLSRISGKTWSDIPREMRPTGYSFPDDEASDS